MYDSTYVSAIPSAAKLILTYLDGDFPTDKPVAIRFPDAYRATTTTTILGDLLALIYDCERGDGNATQAADWARRKLANHQRPTIYCSRIGEPGYGWPDVKAALTAIHIPLTAIDFGIADYTGIPHLVPGSAFTQYANPPKSGGDYDLSITNGIWPHALSPISPYIPTLTEDDYMNATLLPADSHGAVRALIPAVSPQGHLLAFVYNPGNQAEKPTVIDITDGIGNENNGGLFLVQP